MTIEHHPPQALETFAAALFCKVRMAADKAASVARLLVHTDAMGRRTHGLAQAPAYLAEIQKGNMATTGSYVVVKDNGATSALWDGNYLPGLWLVEQAIQTCIPRAEKYGLAAIAIKRNHHIGCLAALFEHAWLQDAHGLPTRDPAVLEQTAPRGSLQLMGGAEYGHKGFGLSLMVEALSQGLSGHGRKDAPKRWGGSTFVQVISPESFSGADAPSRWTTSPTAAAATNPSTRPSPCECPATRRRAASLRRNKTALPSTPTLGQRSRNGLENLALPCHDLALRNALTRSTIIL